MGIADVAPESDADLLWSRQFESFLNFLREIAMSGPSETPFQVPLAGLSVNEGWSTAKRLVRRLAEMAENKGLNLEFMISERPDIAKQEAELLKFLFRRPLTDIHIAVSADADSSAPVIQIIGFTAIYSFTVRIRSVNVRDERIARNIDRIARSALEHGCRVFLAF